MLAGELVLRVEAGAEGVRDVRCVSTRPRLSQALLRGMECALAAQRLGVIYTV